MKKFETKIIDKNTPNIEKYGKKIWKIMEENYTYNELNSGIYKKEYDDYYQIDGLFMERIMMDTVWLVAFIINEEKNEEIIGTAKLFFLQEGEKTYAHLGGSRVIDPYKENKVWNELNNQRSQLIAKKSAEIKQVIYSKTAASPQTITYKAHLKNGFHQYGTVAHTDPSLDGARYIKLTNDPDLKSTS